MIFGYDVEKVRRDFPILRKPIIYFDSACMALKPLQVIDSVKKYYEEYSACAGRSAHRLAKAVEHEVDTSRDILRGFIGAKHNEEIVFTRNTTEGINLVSNSLGLQKGDEVLISDKEHNSNLIPWLKLAQKGVIIKIIYSDENNQFDLDKLKESLSDKTKLVSAVHTSNMDGVTNPVSDIIKIAHKNGSLVLLDGAQSVPHKQVDVRKLDADFLAFSGHKMCGPTGTGVLYGKRELLEHMEQFIVGGETVQNSTYDSFVPEHLPMKFEAGLQDYAGIIGLGEACKYIKKIGLNNIQKHELKINKILTDGLADLEKIQLIGPKEPEQRSGIFSFNIEGMDPHNAARMLDNSKAILVRSGAHCVHSWFNKHNMQGSIRASIYFYNTEEEAKVFVEEVKKLTGF